VTARRFVALASLVSLLGVYALRGPLLGAVGRFLVFEDPPAKADAIVVLAGSFPDRILEAVALYEEGLAPRIVLCREPEGRAMKRLRERGIRDGSGTDRNRDVALELKVPDAAIELVDRPAGSTFGEAKVVLEHMKKHGYHSILLVTSKMHTRRAAWIYRHVAGDDVTIIVRAARDDGFGPDDWWRNRVSTRRLVIEYQKLFVFLLVDQWGSEPMISN